MDRLSGEITQDDQQPVESTGTSSTKYSNKTFSLKSLFSRIKTAFSRKKKETKGKTLDTRKSSDSKSLEDWKQEFKNRIGNKIDDPFYCMLGNKIDNTKSLDELSNLAYKKGFSNQDLHELELFIQNKSNTFLSENTLNLLKAEERKDWTHLEGAYDKAKKIEAYLAEAVNGIDTNYIDENKIAFNNFLKTLNHPIRSEEEAKNVFKSFKNTGGNNPIFQKKTSEQVDKKILNFMQTATNQNEKNKRNIENFENSNWAKDPVENYLLIMGMVDAAGKDEEYIAKKTQTLESAITEAKEKSYLFPDTVDNAMKDLAIECARIFRMNTGMIVTQELLENSL